MTTYSQRRGPTPSRMRRHAPRDLIFAAVTFGNTVETVITLRPCPVRRQRHYA